TGVGVGTRHSHSRAWVPRHPSQQLPSAVSRSPDYCHIQHLSSPSKNKNAARIHLRRYDRTGNARGRKQTLTSCPRLSAIPSYMSARVVGNSPVTLTTATAIHFAHFPSRVLNRMFAQYKRVSRLLSTIPPSVYFVSL